MPQKAQGPDDFKKLAVLPQKGGVMILKGVLDASTITEFEHHLHQITEGSTRHVILDCEHLSFISSAGIGALMSLHGLLDPQQRTIELVRAQPEIYRTFELLGLEKLFHLKKL